MEFLEAYHICNMLWEELIVENKKYKVIVKDAFYDFATPFMPVADFMKLPNTAQSGIYIWRRRPTNKRPYYSYYVGKAKDLVKRTQDHINMRKRDSVALHAAIKKYTKEHFDVAIIEFCAEADLNQRESFWIDELNTFIDKYDYNLKPGGEGGASEYKVTFEMYEIIVDLLQHSRKTMTAIGNDLEADWREEGKKVIDRKTVSNINAGEHYLRKFEPFNKLTYPIRTEEEVDSIVKERHDMQGEDEAGTYELFVKISQLNDKGKVEDATYSLGIIKRLSRVLDTIFEYERGLGTSEEELHKINVDNFRKKKVARFDLLVKTARPQSDTYARRYQAIRIK